MQQLRTYQEFYELHDVSPATHSSVLLRKQLTDNCLATVPRYEISKCVFTKPNTTHYLHTTTPTAQQNEHKH